MKASRLSSEALSAALIILAGAAAYAGALHGPFLFDDVTSLTQNPTIQRLWAWPGALVPPHQGITVEGKAGPESLLRPQLRPRRERGVGVSRGESAYPPARRADAVRDRPTHAGVAGEPGPRLRRRPALDDPSAADRGGHLHGAARRIADGPLLPADPLRLRAALVRFLRAGVPPRHGDEGGHGLRAGAGVFLRPRVYGGLVLRSVAAPPGLLRGAGRHLAPAGSGGL